MAQTIAEQAIEEIKRAAEEKEAKTKAQKLGFSYVNLTGYPISPDVLQIIPQEIAAKYLVVAYLKAAGKLKIAAFDPTNEEVKTAVENIIKPLGLQAVFVVASKSSIESALELYKIGVPTRKLEEEVKVEEMAEEVFRKEIKNLEELKEEIKKIPITKLLDVILAGAATMNSSDIHIEPRAKEFRLRFRIDGVLQDIAFFNIDIYKQLLSRIKMLSKMKLDIRNLPQDGRFTMQISGKPVELRVSILPSIYGETVVMRLLEQEARFLKLADLGISGYVYDVIMEGISKPSGMILNTGPTGSGKTTTLYAILEKLNQPGVKIITLEDPVEYYLPGAVQSQVESENKYTFAVGLRSILRQDPNIIMIGEIRDNETAEIGVHAALTGHLVLSTLHTNNAAAALPRLIDMGIPPFLIASSVTVVIAQRLVRKLCPACKEEYAPDKATVDYIRQVLHYEGPIEKLYRSKGCSLCNGTGYRKRIAIAEALKMDSNIEKLILLKSPASEIQKAALAQGMLTMEQDGLQRVIEGITSLEEVWRVTKG
jgi:type IV pilus assembly protein PilB